MSFLLSAAGTAVQARGQQLQAESSARGFEAQIPGVDFGLQGFLAQLQGVQQQQAATIQAANFNAKIAMQDAMIARDQARAEAVQTNRSNLLRMGSLNAAAGASGITYSGSVVDVVGDLVAQGELARQNALYLGELQARGHEIDAHVESLRARAAYSAAGLVSQQAGVAIEAADYEKRVLRMKAAEARRAGKWAVAGTLLSGAQDTVDQFERTGFGFL